MADFLQTLRLLQCIFLCAIVSIWMNLLKKFWGKDEKLIHRGTFPKYMGKPLFMVTLRVKGIVTWIIVIDFYFMTARII